MLRNKPNVKEWPHFFFVAPSRGTCGGPCETLSLEVVPG